MLTAALLHVTCDGNTSEPKVTMTCAIYRPSIFDDSADAVNMPEKGCC